ncbi:MAG: hypothetical protein ACRD18_14070 [Terriglobia bacterium]
MNSVAQTIAGGAYIDFNVCATCDIIVDQDDANFTAVFAVMPS